MAKTRTASGKLTDIPSGQVRAWRVFNHRRYTYQASAASKSLADQMVKELRNRGHRVRTVRVGIRRDIYADTA